MNSFNMTNTEIERKFLVVGTSYKTHAIKHYEIVQGYLCKDKERTVRVRIRDTRAFLAVKSSNVLPAVSSPSPDVTDGLARYEWEKEIPIEDARQLMKLCLPGIIEKTRYVIPAIAEDADAEPLYWEVDEFHGRQEGLVLAEIELQSEEQLFREADFVGEEVTGDPRYYNANM